MLDATDFLLMNRWQRGFPLAPRPFAEIASASDMKEEEVIAAFSRVVRSELIDRIGPVFRPNTVGASTLAAMAVPPGRLQAVAAIVDRREGVNHNYEREHRYNLWFVITGSDAAAVADAIISIEQATALPVLRLPLQEEYHIDLGFDLDSHAVPRGGSDAAASAVELSADEKRLLSRVTQGLPLVPRPYAELGLPEAQAITALGRWLEAGVVRRIGVVIRHRRLGYRANAMVVWDVPDDAAAELGRRLAADSAVTLCYRRGRSAPDWLYNLYCMIHGRERSRVQSEIRRISALHGLGRYRRAVLFSARCFSQRAARYG